MFINQMPIANPLQAFNSFKMECDIKAPIEHLQ